MIIHKFNNAKKNLSGKELSVADYIFNNRQDIKTMSIQELSKLTQASTSTILRLCKKLGYEGFSDFKIDLIASLNTEYKVIFQEDIGLDDSIEEVNNKVFQMEKSALDETYALINVKQLNQAIDLLNTSNKVVIFGVGNSALIGKELEYQLIKLKKNLCCHFDYHTQRNALSTMDEKDLLIIISHSGETAECVNLLKQAKESHIPSIAITKFGQNKASSLASVVLNTSSNEERLRLIPIRSQISQMTVINILLTNLFIKRYDQNSLLEKKKIKKHFLINK
jgi:RpiR family murPQ operon transcriptional repressor